MKRSDLGLVIELDGNATKGPREAVEEFSAGDITALSKFYEEVKKILGRKK